MNNKKFRYSLNSKVFIVGAVIIVLLLNAILITLNDKISLELDFTTDKIYDLTAETEAIVDQITEPTSITMLTGGTDNAAFSLIRNILSKYTQRNNKITVSELDISKDAARVQVYEQELMAIYQNAGSLLGILIIEQGDRVDFVDPSGFFSNDGYSYIERSVTSKLAQFVDDFHGATVCFTVGHDERISQSSYIVLERAGYSITEIDPLQAEFPDPASSTVIISAPQTDFSAVEIDKLDAYLDRGGNLQIYFDPIYGADNLPILESYLSEDWGIIRNHDVVVDLTNKVEGTLYTLGELKEHEITQPMLNSDVRVGYSPANSLTVSAEKPSTVIEISTLLASRPEAHAKADLTAYSVNIDRESGDTTGPFDIAVAAKRQAKDPNTNDVYTAYLVVSGSVNVYDGLIADTRFGNEDLLLNELSWMNEGQASITVRGKKMPGGEMLLSVKQFYTWLVVLVALIPLALLAGGIVVYIKRRHK